MLTRTPLQGIGMKWFEIILVVLTLGSGLVWLADKLFLAARRAANAGLLDEEPVMVEYARRSSRCWRSC
jgi:signal peptidase I